jgi:hypothetical protein
MFKGLRWFSLAACCLLGAVLGCLLIITNWDRVSIIPVVQAQHASMGQSKYVEREPNVPEESGPYGPENVNFPRNAVRVVKVTVGEQKVTSGPFYPRRGPTGVPFQAGDDWLKELTFTIKNRTSKKLVQVSMAVCFPDTLVTERGPWVCQQIELGRIPESDAYTKDGEKADQGNAQPLDFRPGQEMKISFAPYADDIRRKIEERQPFSTIGGCFINLQSAFFEDGTVWILTPL